MAVAQTTYPFLPKGAAVLTIAQLNAQVRQRLERAYPNVWVEGEICDFKVNGFSGHAYFKLKDETAKLNCVCYQQQLERLPAGFEPKNGLSVIACGHLSLYEPRGDFQLQVQRMYGKGWGDAEAALRALKEKLQRLGYFDLRRKRKLPRYPRCVGLVASATGAAVRDMIEILGRRWPATKVFVRPARVQGNGAAEELATAIRQINRWRIEKRCATDVIILGRGGGSSEDLHAFNDEGLARAILESQIPVVSAVGHEIDTTIADLVADVRASTPSHAAELVVPDREELRCQVEAYAKRMESAQGLRLRQLRKQIDHLAKRREFREPLAPIQERQRGLDDISERLARAMLTRLVQQRLRLDASTARLDSLSPLSVLARGYSLTMADGAVLRSATSVKPGDRMVTRLHQGQVTSRVESIDAGERPN